MNLGQLDLLLVFPGVFGVLQYFSRIHKVNACPLLWYPLIVFGVVCYQVGHEPLPPTLGRNLFGRQVYQLPGLFAYGKFDS